MYLERPSGLARTIVIAAAPETFVDADRVRLKEFHDPGGLLEKMPPPQGRSYEHQIGFAYRLGPCPIKPRLFHSLSTIAASKACRPETRHRQSPPGACRWNTSRRSHALTEFSPADHQGSKAQGHKDRSSWPATTCVPDGYSRRRSVTAPSLWNGEHGSAD